MKSFDKIANNINNTEKYEEKSDEKKEDSNKFFL